MEEDVFEMAKISPLAAAKACRTKILTVESGYHSKLRRCIAEAYAVAYEMSYNYKAWRAFTKEEFWKTRKKRPRVNNSKRALLHVMVYAFNATSKNTYDRAWKYATALQ